jgi:hypothetical protein
MNYETWKSNYETEFAEYRKNNYFIAYYDFEVERELKRLNATIDEFVTVGDFCNYHRKSTLNIPDEINAKYGALFVDGIKDDEFFKAFLVDEFERIRPVTDVDATLSNVFKYRNLPVAVADLDENQLTVFNDAVAEYKVKNAKYIAMFSDD